MAIAIAAGAGFKATGRRITVVDETIAKIATGMMKYPCRKPQRKGVNSTVMNYTHHANSTTLNFGNDLINF